MLVSKSSSRSWPVSLSRLSTCLTAVAIILLPSFLQHKITQRPRPARRLSPTSFLDGLRGVAAVIVFFHHDVDYSANFLNHSYGTHALKSVFQLPFLRLWCSGQPMVHIFFIISGYVLSIKPIRLVREGSWDKLSDVLASAAFRRGFRLFLPSIAGLAFFELTIAMGVQFTKHGFMARLKVLLYSWNWDMPHRGLLHLWTIPVEFSGSLFLFVVILALSRLRQQIRLAAIIAIIAYCLACGRWGPAEFIAGMLLAEVEETLGQKPTHVSPISEKLAALRDVQEQIKTDPDPSPEIVEMAENAPLLTKNCKATIYEMFWLSILIFSLYIAGWSKYKQHDEPLLRHLIPLIPNIYYHISGFDTMLAFPFAFAAFFIVWSIFRLPALQTPFVSAPAQYFGDISYSFYIVHDFLLIGYPRYWVALFANHLTAGRSTPTRALMSVLIELGILFAIVVWLADMFWRLIDRPSVRFARWLEAICRSQESSKRSILLV